MRKSLAAVASLIGINVAVCEPDRIHPLDAKTIRFTVPASAPQLEADEFDFADRMRMAINGSYGSHDNDVLVIHSYRIEVLSESVPLSQIVFTMSFDMTSERRRVMAFMKELNELQGKHGMTICPSSPMLEIRAKDNNFCGGYLLMKHDDSHIMFSRVWGG